MNRKRKIRHVLDWIFAFVIATSLSVLFFLGWVWYGVFNQSALNDWLNAKGYYEIRYEQFVKETEFCLDYLNIPKETLDWEKIHTKFLITSKADVFQNKDESFSDSGKSVQEDQNFQNIQDIEENANVSIGAEICKQLKKYLETQNIVVTAQAQDGIEELEGFLDQAFVKYTQDAQIENWKIKRQLLQDRVVQKCILLGMICLVGSVILIAIQHRKRLACKYIGFGVLLAGLIILARNLYGILTGITKGNFLEQVYQKNGYFLGVIAVLFGLGVMLIPYLLNNRKKS